MDYRIKRIYTRVLIKGWYLVWENNIMIIVPKWGELNETL